MTPHDDAAGSNAPDFLTGGGEMGVLMREHDWRATSLGAPRTWSASLKTAVRLLLNIRHPMYLWWGPDLLCFYNDAYSRTLDARRHPQSLGRPGREVWGEIWPLIGDPVDYIMAGRGSTWDENRTVPITRVDRRDAIYWTCSYSPIDDEAAPGGVGGVLAVCTETTQCVVAERRRTAETDRLSRMFERAPGFRAMLEGPEHRFVLANPAYRQVVGNRDVVGKTVAEILPDAVDQGYLKLLDQMFANNAAFSSSGSKFSMRAVPGGPVDERYVDFVHQAVTDVDGRVTGIFVDGYDVTDRVLAEHRQAFRLSIDERVRDLADPAEIVAATSEALGGHLRVGQVAYAEVEPGGETVLIEREWNDGTMASNAGRHRLDDYGPDFVADLRQGKTTAIADVRLDPRTSSSEALAMFSSASIRAFVNVPLVKAGRLVAVLAIHSATPRAWSPEEVALAEEIAEQTWIAAERGRAEASLSDAKERYLALFNAIDQGFCTIEIAFDERDEPVDYRFLEVSPAFARQTGIENGAGRWMREIAPGQDRHWFETYGRVARTGEPARFENYSTPLDRWWAVYAFRISGPNRVAVLFRDITDQKRAEAALRDGEVRLRALNDTLERQVRERTAERNRVWEMSRDLFAVMGFDGCLKAINPAWEATLGRDAETLLSLSFREQVHPDDHDAVKVVMDRLLDGETVERFEDRLQHADGSWRWISWTLVPEGEVFYAVGRDVTEEREHAAALRLHENIVQSDRSPICCFDTDYRLIAFNQAHNDEFRRVNGFDTKLGDVFPDLFVAEQRPIMRALMGRALSGERFTVVEEFGRPELGTPCWEITYTPLRDEAGRITGAFHQARDITDRLLAEAELTRAQEQLRQAQKMEAMGQLTGGVAHDFNNLLTPIVGSLDLLQRKGFGGERERRLIDGAMQSAERARTLVQRLLAFARRQPLQTQAVDIVALVGGMADLVASTSGPRVRVEIDIADDLPAATADANQVEMAILNLAVNARDAMPEGGMLTISAKPVSAGEGERSGLRPGRYVCLSIADSGIGMDEATLARAVEPFYSTKGVGRGTGLGLSMAHGLAAQLGGGLLISSKPGLGTCVELYLPASEQAAQEAQRHDVEQARPAAGTVLLVDDEELVRMSTADMLTDLGYAVVEAASAEEALRLIDSGQRYDVLVTDHLMPGVSGTDLARELRDRRPDMAVLIVSGYAEADGIAPDLPRLAKPFRQGDLSAKLRELHGADIA